MTTYELVCKARGWRKADGILGKKIRKLVRLVECGDDRFPDGIHKCDWYAMLDAGWYGDFNVMLAREAKKKIKAPGRPVWFVNQSEWTSVNIFIGTRKDLVKKIDALIATKPFLRLRCQNPRGEQ